jgi:hypothetical protein
LLARALGEPVLSALVTWQKSGGGGGGKGLAAAIRGGGVAALGDDFAMVTTAIAMVTKALDPKDLVEVMRLTLRRVVYGEPGSRAGQPIGDNLDAVFEDREKDMWVVWWEATKENLGGFFPEDLWKAFAADLARRSASSDTPTSTPSSPGP